VPRALAISAAPAGLRAAGVAVQWVLGRGRGGRGVVTGRRNFFSILIFLIIILEINLFFQICSF
jgi:hypothetical protein